MKYGLRLLLLIAVLPATGCTTRAAYEAVRQNVRQTCVGEFSDAERAQCLARTQDDYDTYTEKRRAVRDDQARAP